MSATATLARPRAEPGADTRLSGFLAYVSDADSEAVLRRVAAQLALAGLDLRRGDVRTAERDLKTEASPAILIVDVSSTDTVLEAMQRLSEVCEPQIQVVVIGARNDVGLYRELIALGAADYLYKPLAADLVETVIWRLMTGEARGNEARIGKLVAITGARGGVGGSTIAANLGGYLAEKAARRVVLVDADVRSGALALLLGHTPNAGLADVLETPSRIDDLFLERAKIAAGPRLDLFASEMPIGRRINVAPEACDALITRLRRSYHYVLVDVPAAVRDAFEPLIAAATLQIVIAEATLLAARDAARLVTQAGAAQRAIVVHNKAGRAGDLAAADFTTALGRAPDAALPFSPRAFGESVNLGRAAWSADAKIEAGVARLARELSGQGGDAPRRPLLQRLAASFA